MNWYKIGKSLLKASIYIAAVSFGIAVGLMVFSIGHFGLLAAETQKMAGWALECAMAWGFSLWMYDKNI